MTVPVLEAMMMIVKWREKDTLCNQEDVRCTECPYDKGRICDTENLEFILRYSGEIFKRYFDQLE